MKMQQFENKTEFMAHCAQKLMEKYPKNSNFRYVSSKVGVSASTFERILKKEVTNPSLINIVKIFRAAYPDGDIGKFIEKFCPGLLPKLKNVYPHNDTVSFAASDAEEFFARSTTYEIMLYALSMPDLTRIEIGRLFGEKGLSILDQLISRGIIKKDGDKIFIEGPLKLGQTTSYDILKNLLGQNYDIDSFGNKENWLSVNTKAVDKEKAMPIIKEILAKAENDIWEALDAPELKGRDIVWAGLVMDSMQSNNSPIYNADKENNTPESEGDILQ